MAKVPTDLSGREVRSALERAGFVFRRQTGSHMILRRDDSHVRVVIPDHKQIRQGTLRRIIADAGVSVEQFRFLQLLKS
ncbi:MAG: type II toxin-antitoxin system HicA family toxin [Candidatus Melainabacteria bacterium]|nr:type II toxin-antitoxin system HicA family toxin [Candidatus Melainabacteria bacterium]